MTDNRFDGLDPTAQSARQRQRAKSMRRDPTPAERQLWTMLRAGRLNGAKFRRQYPIGPYIADFACAAALLVVEADGAHHNNEIDAPRTAWLARQGWRVVRFPNRDILDWPDGVANAIAAALTSPLPPTPSAWAPPSPARGEGLEYQDA